MMKHTDADVLFNRRVIISELESGLNDDGRGPAQDVPYDLILWYVSKTIYLS